MQPITFQGSTTITCLPILLSYIKVQRLYVFVHSSIASIAKSAAKKWILSQFAKTNSLYVINVKESLTLCSNQLAVGRISAKHVETKMHSRNVSFTGSAQRVARSSARLASILTKPKKGVNLKSTVVINERAALTKTK